MVAEGSRNSVEYLCVYMRARGPQSTVHRGGRRGTRRMSDTNACTRACALPSLFVALLVAVWHAPSLSQECRLWKRRSRTCEEGSTSSSKSFPASLSAWASTPTCWRPLLSNFCERPCLRCVLACVAMRAGCACSEPVLRLRAFSCLA